jgi:hypothetical protein
MFVPRPNARFADSDECAGTAARLPDGATQTIGTLAPSSDDVIRPVASRGRRRACSVDDDGRSAVLGRLATPPAMYSA